MEKACSLKNKYTSLKILLSWGEIESLAYKNENNKIKEYLVFRKTLAHTLKKLSIHTTTKMCGRVRNNFIPK